MSYIAEQEPLPSRFADEFDSFIQRHRQVLFALSEDGMSANVGNELDLDEQKLMKGWFALRTTADQWGAWGNGGDERSLHMAGEMVFPRIYEHLNYFSEKALELNLDLSGEETVRKVLVDCVDILDMSNEMGVNIADVARLLSKYDFFRPFFDDEYVGLDKSGSNL